MQHTHTQVSSRSGHVSLHLHRSKSLSVSVGQSEVCLMFFCNVSAAAQRRNIKLGRGAVTTACFAIISRGHDVEQLLPCDDISRFQDVENDD